MSNATQNCLFVGGPLNDQAKDIADYVNEIFIPYEGSLLGLPQTIEGLESDYSRWEESPIFIHTDLTEAEFSTFLLNRGILEDEDGCDDECGCSSYEDDSVQCESPTAFQAYVLGIRDACDLILNR